MVPVFCIICKSFMCDFHLRCIDLPVSCCWERPARSLSFDNAAIIASQTEEAGVVVTKEARRRCVRIFGRIHVHGFVAFGANLSCVASTHNTNSSIVTRKSFDRFSMFHQLLQKTTESCRLLLLIVDILLRQSSAGGTNASCR